MNPWLATAAYILAGLTVSYICDRDSQLSDEPGGWAIIILIVAFWPLAAIGALIVGAYHLFAATIDAFRR